MTDAQKRGAIVFFDDGKCLTCHTDPALKNQSFHAFGFGDFDNAEDTVNSGFCFPANDDLARADLGCD